jgi:hypothetical protein
MENFVIPQVKALGLVIGPSTDKFPPNERIGMGAQKNIFFKLGVAKVDEYMFP